VAILESEHEIFLGSLFLRAIDAGEYGYKVNFEIVKLTCKRAKLDELEVYDILSYMCAKANKAK
jgi:triphosphoribosyl-dephospho-CoA synthetase